MTIPAGMAAAGAMSDAALAREVAQLRQALGTIADQLNRLNGETKALHPKNHTPEMTKAIAKALSVLGALHAGFSQAPSGGGVSSGSNLQVKSLGLGVAADGNAGDIKTPNGTGSFSTADSAAGFFFQGGGQVYFLGTLLAPNGDTTMSSGTPTRRWSEVDSKCYRGMFVQLVYGVGVTPDASYNDNIVDANNATAFAVNAPINPPNAALCQEFNLTIRNTSGGALGVATFNAVFKMTAWVQPATGFNRTITFRSKDAGVTWYEIGRTAADVPN